MAQMATLSVPEAQKGLRFAKAQGNYAYMWHLSSGLVRARPDDYEARAAMAESAIRLGRGAEGQQAAKAAQRLARSPQQKFEARLLRAQALGVEGGAIDGLLANFHARRALEAAPFESHRALAFAEAQRLRRYAKLEVQLSLSISPSDNVNNGSYDSTLEVPGWGGIAWVLAPPSRALSGWVAEARLGTRYRLAQGAHYLRHAYLQASRREVGLSSSSKAAIEEWRIGQAASGGKLPNMPNYDYGQLEVGLSELRQIGPYLVSVRSGLGHSWYGGKDLADFARLHLGAERGFGPTLALWGAVSLDRHWAKGAAQDYTQVALEGGSAHRLGGGDHLRAGFVLRQTRSDSLDQRHNAAGVNLLWQPSAPIAGTKLEASLGAEWRRYQPTLLGPDGRRDLRLEGGLSLGLEALGYMGFTPQVMLTVGRVKSNLRLYEGNSQGVSVRWISAF